MCIIIHQPQGHVFSRREICDFWNRNKEGFGLMWTGSDGQPEMRKWVFDKPHQAVSAYYDFAAGKECVLHYRMATSGPVDLEHAHPFKISADLLMVHNGILDGGSKTESDTAQFVRQIMKPLLSKDFDLLYDPTVVAHIEAMIGSNVLVFLDAAGSIHKLGSKGVTHDGCWYSNTYAWNAPQYLLPKWESEDWRDYRGNWRSWGGADREERESIIEAAFSEADAMDLYAEDTDPRLLEKLDPEYARWRELMLDRA